VKLTGFSLSLDAGAQAQWEDWSSTAKPPGPGAEKALSQSRASASGEVRLRLLWSAWPEVLSLRGRGDLSVQSLTRNDLVAPPAGAPTGTPSGEPVTQLDLRVRGLVDVEALRFFGFLPSLHVGLNYERVDTAAHLSPVLGLGLRRATF
jgi:hypothetical protein